jgi:hypothetical protein
MRFPLAQGFAEVRNEAHTDHKSEPVDLNPRVMWMAQA